MNKLVYSTHKKTAFWAYFKILAVLLLAFPATGRSFDYNFSGYVKYLYSNSKYPGFSRKIDNHLIHGRLNSKFYFGKNWSFALETRWRTYYGSAIEKIPFFKEQIIHHYPFTDLGWQLANEKKLFSYLEIDRLYVDYQGTNWEFTVGRQRIAWGTSLVWNVIDLFNPLSILDFDYEEHPGNDALRLQYFTGPVSHVEIAYSPAKTSDKQTFALLWGAHAGEYDLYFLAGIKQRRRLAGFAWSGYIRDAGFRGELKISDPPSKGLPTVYPLLFLPQLTDNRQVNVQAVLSFDYSFPNSFYVHSEMYFNRDGVLQNAGFYRWQTSEADMLSPARWSLFQEAAYQITPLIRSDAFILFNPNDHSFVLVPSVSWNATTNLDWYLIGFFSKGSPNTEFGDIGKAGFIRLKYSF